MKLKNLFSMKRLTLYVMVLLGVFLIGMGVNEKDNAAEREDKITAHIPNNVSYLNKSNFPKFKGVSISSSKTKKIEILDLKNANVVKLIGVVRNNAKVVADEIREYNKTSEGVIFLIIDSPGGSVIDGANLIAAIQASKLPIITICYNFCASMGAMIHQYGDKRLAVDRSIIMFHPAHGGMQGNIDVMHRVSRAFVRYIGKIEQDIANRLGFSYEQYKALVVEELWIDAEDALDANFIDGLVDVQGAKVNKFFLFNKQEIEELKENSTLTWVYEGLM